MLRNNYMYARLDFKGTVQTGVYFCYVLFHNFLHVIMILCKVLHGIVEDIDDILQLARRSACGLLAGG